MFQSVDFGFLRFVFNSSREESDIEPDFDQPCNDVSKLWANGNVVVDVVYPLGEQVEANRLRRNRSVQVGLDRRLVGFQQCLSEK